METGHEWASVAANAVSTLRASLMLSAACHCVNNNFSLCLSFINCLRQACQVVVLPVRSTSPLQPYRVAKNSVLEDKSAGFFVGQPGGFWVLLLLFGFQVFKVFFSLFVERSNLMAFGICTGFQFVASHEYTFAHNSKKNKRRDPQV